MLIPDSLDYPADLPPRRSPADRHHPLFDLVRGRLYGWPLCSGPKNSASEYAAGQRPVSEAIQFPMVAINHGYVQAIIVDVDRAGAVLDVLDRCDELNLPPPNICVENAANGHAHCLWLLADPIWVGEQRGNGWVPSVVDYWRKTVEALRAALGGDPAFKQHGLVKYPFHKMHRARVIHDRLAKLQDIAGRLDLSEVRVEVDPAQRGSLWRNEDLFRRVANWSYPRRHEFVDREAWRMAVLASAEEFNEEFAASIKGPLDQVEVRNIAKSVADWTWRNVKGKPGTHTTHNPGIMALDKSMPIGQRLRAGQAYAAETRRSSTLGKLISLYEPGMTQSRMAELSGRSLRTVKAYWGDLHGAVHHQGI